MTRNHPGIPFERYADDVICHCSSEEQAADAARRRLRAVRGMRTDAASGEDENRLLQG